MTQIGLQISPRNVRAVVVAGWPRTQVRTVEFPFGVDRLPEALDALRPVAGRARRVGVAVDLQLLRIKRLTLPAVSAVQRRNIVQLEPERFFAVRGEDLIPAVRADDGLVFAATTAALERWITTIEGVAPVELIEPTPLALARALARVAVRDATLVLDGQEMGIGIAQIRDGQLTRARRLFGGPPAVGAALAADGILVAGAPVYLDPWADDAERVLASVCRGIRIEPLPTLETGRRSAQVPGPFVAAYAAALGAAGAPRAGETLLGPKQEMKVRSRRSRALALAGASCGVALAFAIGSLDDRWDRAARDLEIATRSLTTQAAPALGMQTELASLERRSEAIRAIDGERGDPLRVLRALSTSLPTGAFVRQVRASGKDWQIDGYAPNASAVLTALGTSADFRDVHFLSATSRAQVASHTYESFALAFRFAGAP